MRGVGDEPAFNRVNEAAAVLSTPGTIVLTNEAEKHIVVRAAVVLVLPVVATLPLGWELNAYKSGSEALTVQFSDLQTAYSTSQPGVSARFVYSGGSPEWEIDVQSLSALTDVSLASLSDS